MDIKQLKIRKQELQLKKKQMKLDMDQLVREIKDIDAKLKEIPKVVKQPKSPRQVEESKSDMPDYIKKILDMGPQ